eukprot:COSAG06_NODE_12768_length_1332_cov_1.245742_1_plen_85_part_10
MYMCVFNAPVGGCSQEARADGLQRAQRPAHAVAVVVGRLGGIRRAVRARQDKTRQDKTRQDKTRQANDFQNRIEYIYIGLNIDG